MFPTTSQAISAWLVKKPRRLKGLSGGGILVRNRQKQKKNKNITINRRSLGINDHRVNPCKKASICQQKDKRVRGKIKKRKKFI